MKFINLDKLESDTTGWSDYCLGYHSLKIPPGLRANPGVSTNIDWNYPKVERNYSGSALSYIASDRRFGGVVFKTRVNDWDFVVSSERIDEDLISDFSLVFYGARKFGNDVILFTKDASSSRVANVQDAKYRIFYEKLHAEEVALDNREGGFCFDGYVFSGYTPQHVYSFASSFTSSLRHGYRVDLSQEMTPPPKSDRPLAPQSPPVIPSDISVSEYAIKKNGNNGVVTKITGVGDEAESGFIKALSEGPYGDLYRPIISAGSTSEIKSMSNSMGEAEFLTFLANIRAN